MHARLLLPLLITALSAAPAAAIDRIELAVGTLQMPDGTITAIEADWTLDGALKLQSGRIRAGGLPPLRASLQCGRFSGRKGLRCDKGRATVDVDGIGKVRADLEARLDTLTRGNVQLRKAEATVGYNAADGTVAAEQLQMALEGELLWASPQQSVRLRFSLPSGQAYLEPLFLDLDRYPVNGEINLTRQAGSPQIELQTLRWQQRDTGTLEASGHLRLATPMQHSLQLRLETDTLDAVLQQYLLPFAPGTRIEGLQASGSATMQGHLQNAAPTSVDVSAEIDNLEAPRLGLGFSGLILNGHWRIDNIPPTPSRIRWASAHAGRLPIGATALAVQTDSRGFSLLEPVRIPVLNGALAIQQLALGNIGAADMTADFAATIEPISLRQLGKTLDWPEFRGELSGKLPGMTLRDGHLDVDGAITAKVFDGSVRIDQLQVLDVFGVLPRVAADVQLRQLDLAELTSAFDFGRIDGRLDGDVNRLRLIGWMPVAMDAHLYSSPGDRSRRRISQRAIDSISSIGGGPTGLLSRGFMSLFDDFGYRSIGWRCRLQNGICRMGGVEPGPDGRGYVLVKGSGLPRVDVIGYSENVDWNTLLAQLRSLQDSGPPTVRGG